MLTDFKGNKLPDFDYSKYGLDAIAQEADTYAAQIHVTLSNIGNLTAKLILEDTTRLLAIREILKSKQIWVQWLKTKYPKGHQTVYNAFEISSTLEKLRNDHPARFLEIENNLLHCSQRALLALSRAGENTESILTLLETDTPTEKQVREYAPATQKEVGTVLKQVDKYADNNELDKHELRLETELLAQDIAERRGRITPSATDYQEAGSQITGSEVRLPKKVKATPTISPKDYQEIQETCRRQHQEIQELRELLDEKERAIKYFLDVLAAQGIEVAA